MSEETSPALRAAVNARETPEVFLFLVTIEHPDLEEEIRVVHNTEDIVSRGETFKATWFNGILPNEQEDAPAQARLSIDNISPEILNALRSLQSNPLITLEVVLASDPDLVTNAWPDMELRAIDYDPLTIEGTLTYENIYNEPDPGDLYTPGSHPGLFLLTTEEVS